jgi:hypothetical protein
MKMIEKKQEIYSVDVEYVLDEEDFVFLSSSNGSKYSPDNLENLIDVLFFLFYFISIIISYLIIF